ncbi:MAG: PspC domain-containing protein [Ignavibacteria bacterium]
MTDNAIENLRNEEEETPQGTDNSGDILFRSVHDKMIFGVCAGFADYMNVKPNLLRIIWLVLTFITFGIGALIYLLFAIIVPEEDNGGNIGY